MSVYNRPDTRRFFTRLSLFPLSGLVALNLIVHVPHAFAGDEHVPTASSVNPLSIVPKLDLSGLLGTVVPSEIILADGFNPAALATARFDLLQYMKNNIDNRSPSEVVAAIPKYKRLEMFGSWVNETAPADCFNTRAEVLLRDANPGAKISFSPGNPCQVAKGQWHDPYGGADYKLASAVQIDHVVPLKNAYRSGAHAWNRDRRCHYANFLVDKQHLLAVSGHENMSKGDSGPEAYLPPDPAYVCQYVANWMRIKAVWNLTFNADEEAAVETALRENGCRVSSTHLTLPEIQKSRALSMNLNSKCAEPSRAL